MSALDTSGIVPACNPLPDGKTLGPLGFHDLSPFEQGYVMAVLSPAPMPGPLIDAFRFTDLAPETLMQIRVDCAYGVGLFAGPVNHPHFGAELWLRRQSGDFLLFPMSADKLPPLRRYLGTDGKVRFQ